MEVLPDSDRLVDTPRGGAMTTRKVKVLARALVTALVAAGVLAAVAMAWPQSEARPLEQQQRQPQPAEELPVGGPTESALNYPA
jgi:hypothetical protein